MKKVFKGVELRYQKIETFALTEVIAARKLRSYFQSQHIIVKTNDPIFQVLKKLNLARRIIP